ncbi:hypothetical protein Tco_0308207 [Tanacetum coccineum]
MAVIEDCWFQAMQDEIHEFDRLEVMGNKKQSSVVAKGYRQWMSKTAFLMVNLPEEVFVNQPEKDLKTKDNPTHVYPTEKALYWALIKSSHQVVIRWQSKMFPLKHQQERLSNVPSLSMVYKTGKAIFLFTMPQKIQKNPIFQISVDILRNTTSSKERLLLSKCSWPSHSAKGLRYYSCRPAHPFELPPLVTTVIEFVNSVGVTTLQSTNLEATSSHPQPLPEINPFLDLITKKQNLIGCLLKILNDTQQIYRRIDSVARPDHRLSRNKNLTRIRKKLIRIKREQRARRNKESIAYYQINAMDKELKTTKRKHDSKMKTMMMIEGPSADQTTQDRNDQRKLMRLNEIHKFSDGTLTRVMEKLDHMVKDFHLFEYNKGMETRKWSEDDKRRSKDFITAIEKRLQIRRIF